MKEWIGYIILFVFCAVGLLTFCATLMAKDVPTTQTKNPKEESKDNDPSNRENK
jgi:hypothetical protein